MIRRFCLLSTAVCTVLLGQHHLSFIGAWLLVISFNDNVGGRVLAAESTFTSTDRTRRDDLLNNNNNNVDNDEDEDEDATVVGHDDGDSNTTASVAPTTSWAPSAAPSVHTTAAATNHTASSAAPSILQSHAPSTSPTASPTTSPVAATTTAPSPSPVVTAAPTAAAAKNQTTAAPSPAPQPKQRMSFWRFLEKTIAFLVLLVLGLLGFGAIMSNRYRIYFFLRGVWYTILSMQCTQWILRKLRLSDYQPVDSGLNTVIFEHEMDEGLLMRESDNLE